MLKVVRACLVIDIVGNGMVFVTLHAVYMVNDPYSAAAAICAL
jgi:hypothetical protein